MQNNQIKRNERSSTDNYQTWTPREWLTKIISMPRNKEDFNSPQNSDGQTILMCATKYSDCKIMQQVLNAKDAQGKRLININAQDKNGNTALSIAVEMEDNEKIELLLKNDADIELAKEKISRKMEKKLKNLLQNFFSSVPNYARDCNKQNPNGTTYLMVAVIKGETEQVKQWLAQPNINVNLQDNQGRTALMLALKHKEIVKLLLKHPDIDVNLRNKEGITALMHAATKGYKDVVEVLLNHPDIDVNVLCYPFNKGYRLNALMFAVWENKKEVVELLLKHPKIDVRAKCHLGDEYISNQSLLKEVPEQVLNEINNLTKKPEFKNIGYPLLNAINNSDNGLSLRIPKEYNALTIAAGKGYKEIVELLLNHPDIDINAFCYPFSALSCAVREGHLEIVKLLLDHPQIIVIGGESYLGLADHRGHSDVFELLSRHPKIINKNNLADCLGNAATQNNEKGLELLLKQGADVNEKDFFGFTPLMYAIEAGHARIVKLLMDQPSIDLNLKINGETALDCAKRVGRRNVIRLLQSKMGLQSQQFDPFREKVKHLPEEKIYEEFWQAISRGDINEMDSFQDEEGKILVDINKGNKDGDTALLIATENGNLTVVKWLLECEVDLSVKDANGDNALIRAAKKGHFDVVEELLFHKMNINSTGQHKKTALMAATENGHIRVVKLLLKKGAKSSVKDDYDKTALDIVNEIIKKINNADDKNYESIKNALEKAKENQSKQSDLPFDDEVELSKKWEVITDKCKKDLKNWEKDDPDTYKKIQMLIEYIERDPFRGIGQVERLSCDLEGFYSRRINRHDRLVYEIDGEKVILNSCKGHYQKEKRNRTRTNSEN